MMTSGAGAVESTRVLYCGMPGMFSASVFGALLRSDPVRSGAIQVAAVAVPATLLTSDTPPVAVEPPIVQSGASVPLTRRPLAQLGAAPVPSLARQAADHAVPVLAIQPLRRPDVVPALLGAVGPVDAIVVACFPWRTPPALLCAPPLGCLNTHPSLLPANRGPDPFFWAFRHADACSGVTVHLMDEGLDTGPILLQDRIAIPPGTTEAQLECICGSRGGELLADALCQLAAGTARPRPQDPACATAYGFPSPSDFRITGRESAESAYRFAAGVADRPEGVWIVASNGAEWRVRTALGYDAAATLPGPQVIDGDEFWLRCQPGVFHARVWG